MFMKTKRNPQKKVFPKNIMLLIAVAVIGFIIYMMSASQPTFACETGSQNGGLEEGKVSPCFTLDRLGPQTPENISLEQFRGKIVFVNFWASWCPFCINELPNFNQIQSESNGEIVVLAVNRGEGLVTQLDYIQNSARSLSNIIFLHDPTDSVSRLYALRVMPTTYVLNKNGVIVARKFGEISLIEMRELVQLAKES